MGALVRAELTTTRETGSAVAAQVPIASAWHKGIRWLAELVLTILTFGGRLRVSVDDSLGTPASGTVTLTQASLTAGDAVTIVYGGIVATLSAVTGAADASLGQWSRDTSSTAAATSLALAINTFQQLKGIVTATSSVGVVTITAVTPGAAGNAIAMFEKDASGGIALSGALLSGGVSPGSLQAILVTFTGTGTAADTITIGGNVITLVASAANEDQCTIGGTAAITATNLIAVINANTKLRGLVVASSGGSGIVRLTFQLAGRIGRLVTLAKSSTAISALPAADFRQTTADAWRRDAVTWQAGGVTP